MPAVCSSQASVCVLVGLHASLSLCPFSSLSHGFTFQVPLTQNAHFVQVERIPRATCLSGRYRHPACAANCSQVARIPRNTRHVLCLRHRDTFQVPGLDENNSICVRGFQHMAFFHKALPTRRHKKAAGVRRLVRIGQALVYCLVHSASTAGCHAGRRSSRRTGVSLSGASLLDAPTFVYLNNRRHHAGLRGSVSTAGASGLASLSTSTATIALSSAISRLCCCSRFSTSASWRCKAS